jgi:hypothetical protein
MKNALFRVTMPYRAIIGALTVVLLLAGARSSRATMLPVNVQPIAGTYSGLSPCADCEGIVTTITLVDSEPNAGIQSGTFVMTMVYKGRATRTRITGHWDMVPPPDMRGSRQSGVVRLIPLDDGTFLTPRYYYCESGQTLRMLDANMQELPDLVPHTLNRLSSKKDQRK